MLLQFLINGLITGLVYALLALGFAIVYNTTRIFHIVYSALYMIAPYIVFELSWNMGLPLVIGGFISVIVVALVSILIDIIFYTPLEKKSSSQSVIMITSIGIMTIGINLIALFFSSETRFLTGAHPTSISVNKIIITYNQLFQFIISSLTISLFFIYLKYSNLGLQAKALRDNKILCEIYGVDIPRVKISLYFLSGIFAAVAGILVSCDIGFDPYIGMPMFLNALVAIIIGGIGSFRSPVVGGIVLGIIQSVVVWKFSSNWQDAVTFIILILVLLLRPHGFFGEKQRFV